ncbi:MAG: aminopeptidase [Lachnospiraceae bacterium]
MWKLSEEELELAAERYELSVGRIREIEKEQNVPERYRDYFKKQAEFILNTVQMAELVKNGTYQKLSLEELEQWNERLYRNILPEQYEETYENPAFAVKRFGIREGRLFTWLAARMYELIFDAAEKRSYQMTILMELFIEIYCRYEEYDEFAYKDAKAAVKSFEMDNRKLYQSVTLTEGYDTAYTFAKDIIQSSVKKGAGDLTYLYQYGEYITDNERKVAEYLNLMPEQEVRAMADTYVSGYLRGFETMKVTLKEHGQILLRYPIGFERMMAYAIESFEAKGFGVTAKRTALRGRVGRKAGYSATTLNPQFEYDHRQDEALYFDKLYSTRSLEDMKNVYEENKELLKSYIGPAVVETFGNPEFVPVNKKEALHLDKRQTKLNLEDMTKRNNIAYSYIRSDETSFTIIAYPVPSIGEQFEEIFSETVRCNNLDNAEYQRIQQTIIDELDTGYACQIKGTDGNETDLTVMLYELKDPAKETIFENCTADVNIPVGEVFTSPKLAGTNGLLHVSRVFLNGYEYKQLKIRFENGRTTKLSCENFSTEAENQAFLEETLLKHHAFLPLGEFAIGTNTTAFVMGERFGIASRLPILIAEKTGPHFAIGDTCYTRSEDHRVYNRDGKEIMARDNEITLAFRKTNPSEAYFNCHTDITIPYGEIGEIASLKKDGTKTAVIRNGRFVLPGTESLNVPLEEYEKKK